MASDAIVAKMDPLLSARNNGYSLLLMSNFDAASLNSAITESGDDGITHSSAILPPDKYRDRFAVALSMSAHRAVVVERMASDGRMRGALE
ncbi:hypothetical protein SAMN05446927_0149 [Caballeronia arationis]|jgi:hypothetical protein|uniref:Uncharacterized protein n=1 Tax=Caballeronia arationis TaxID=1777142 RepID=A0A7Z7I0Z4_9BURK|nr:hypothetical protein [Caballeronia arationis]SOE46692.1 hypothetical protein SAMN05446927_0149 [Caballeronia arationis]